MVFVDFLPAAVVKTFFVLPRAMPRLMISTIMLKQGSGSLENAILDKNEESKSIQVLDCALNSLVIILLQAKGVADMLLEILTYEEIK
jgi:hypothetical protein